MCMTNLPDPNHVEENIIFHHGDKKYRTDVFAYASVSQKIVLPDGKLIQVLGWNETFPPKVMSFEEVSHGFSDKSPAQIAAHFNAAIAHEC